MRVLATVMLWLLPLAACTPVGERWPSADQIDRQRIEPVAPIADAPDTPDHPGSSSTCLGAPMAPVDALHPALTVDLRLDSPDSLEVGESADLAARLRNRSSSEGYRTVLPGDGSEVGWREPQVWYSGFLDAGDGCWRPIPERDAARCGHFDEAWQDDVVTLAPGQTVPIEWLGSAASMLDMQQPGRVRIYLHYAYREGRTRRGSAPTGTVTRRVDPGAMRGIEAFELVSNPVELTLVRPLELSLTPRPRPGGAVSRVADVVALHLRNVSDQARDILPPNAHRLRFEVEGTEQSWPSASWRPEDDARPVRSLPAGAQVELLGAAGLDPTLRYQWHHPVAEVIRIRASYRPYEDRPGVELRSAWVEVDLR